MAELKTQRNDDDVTAFLAGVADENRRADTEAACRLMAEVTGAPPTMWGSSIIGFGTYHYIYATGREGDWPAVGLSPRKQALTLYISTGFDEHADLLARLGPHTIGKSCLHLKRLAAVDEAVLRDLIKAGFDHLNGRTLTSEPG